MSKFELIHKSKLHAFIDGAATALACVWLYRLTHKPESA